MNFLYSIDFHKQYIYNKINKFIYLKGGLCFD